MMNKKRIADASVIVFFLSISLLLFLFLGKRKEGKVLFHSRKKEGVVFMDDTKWIDIFDPFFSYIDLFLSDV